MIKKITFVLILCFVIISCGKKGDPVYKESKIITESENIFIKRV